MRLPLRRRNDDDQAGVAGAGDLGVEDGVEMGEDVGNVGAPLGVEGAAIEEIDGFDGGDGFGESHLRFDFAERTEQFRRRSVDQREEPLKVALFGGEEAGPVLHLLGDEGGEGARKTIGDFGRGRH